MSKFHKFAPLLKIEEQTDGTLLVHSLITAQQPDLDKEVCDYATTKEFYAKRGAENLAKTSVPGMTPSVMPIREMHQLKAIGAGRSIEYNDSAKTIHGLTHIVEPTAVLKFRSGVLIGFSQGGEYVKKWDDPDFPGCVRYTADPFEWSAVDAPCLPSAVVDSMKGQRVALMKAGGSIEEITLVIPTSEARRVDRITELLKRAVSDRDRKAITRACAKIALKKGMYEVGWLADIVEGLNWLCLQSEFERDLEDDGSKVPDGLREAWLELLAQFKAMAIEEADEMAAAGGKGEKGMKITDQAGLTKAAKSISDLLDKHMEMHKGLHEKIESTLSKDHPIAKAHQAMMDHCEKCQKSAKDAMAGEDGESEADKAAKAAKDAADAVAKAAADAAAAAAATDPIAKAVTAALAPFVVKLDALEKKIATTPAPAAIPHTGAGELGKGLRIEEAYGELIGAK